MKPAQPHFGALRCVLPLAAAMLATAGCVTINIYFPAAAAEKAADKIIDEVWQDQSRDGAKAAPTPTPAPAKK